MTSTTQTHKRLERMRPTRLSLREERYNTKEMYNMGRGRTTSSKWSTSEAGWVGGGWVTLSNVFLLILYVKYGNR